ncbi:hypothetical protein GcC1_023018 [Golovinomyces cichoracearum]|uniref:Myb/SANT-like domain-containing protein n=1 Tax=Golovinomyces cichoracearum TaxID=62708 RepID=A0A420J4K7_9PEZI|nr:hypothetical protein GcC1_023018 [Golovinomyces cichoracearum]
MNWLRNSNLLSTLWRRLKREYLQVRSLVESSGWQWDEVHFKPKNDEVKLKTPELYVWKDKLFLFCEAMKSLVGENGGATGLYVVNCGQAEHSEEEKERHEEDEENTQQTEVIDMENVVDEVDKDVALITKVRTKRALRESSSTQSERPSKRTKVSGVSVMADMAREMNQLADALTDSFKNPPPVPDFSRASTPTSTPLSTLSAIDEARDQISREPHLTPIGQLIMMKFLDNESLTKQYVRVLQPTIPDANHAAWIKIKLEHGKEDLVEFIE